MIGLSKFLSLSDPSVYKDLICNNLSERGILDPERIHSLINLTYNPYTLLQLQDMLDPEDLAELFTCLLFDIDSNNKFKDRILIPILHDFGYVIAIAGWDYKKVEDSKYINTRFKKSWYLFNLFHALHTINELNFVIITEGYFDSITAFDRGVTNVVSLMGASLSPYQILKIIPYCDRAILLLDNDDAGLQGMAKGCNQSTKDMKIVQCNLPKEYKDLDEFFVKGNHDRTDLFDLVSISLLKLQ